MLALLRRNRDYRLVFLAQVVSFAGDWFATVALVGLVIDRTNSDFLATLVWVAASLPTFLLSTIAGPTADRYDRKRIMMIASALQAAATGLFLVALHSWVGWGLVAQALVAAIGAFFGPASNAALPNLVDPEDLPTAVAISGATWGAMLAIGSAVGAIVAAHLGRSTAFVLDGLSFLVAAMLISGIKRPTQAANTGVRPRMQPLKDTAEALRYARGNKYVSALLLSKAGFGFGTGVVGLLAVLAKRNLGAGDGGIGLLLFGRGAGVLIGPMIVRRFGKDGLPAILRICGIGALCYGAFYLVVPNAGHLWIAAILVFCAHLGGGAQWTGTSLGLQLATHDSVRGRVLSADFALVTLTMSVSLGMAGLLSSVWGPRTAMMCLALVEVCWGLVYLVKTRDLRNAPAPTFS